MLTITTTHQPATDLGYLLYKNPSRLQTFDLSFGKARVFYPEATDARCTMAMLLEIDPVGLVRDRRGPAGDGFALRQYVNDRPYVASSFMSVTIAQVLGSALAGQSRERPDLVDQKLPLEATLAVLPCRGGDALLRKLFEPLGYVVEATHLPLDDHFPEWGESPYWSLTLRAETTVHDLLSHLYVLIPVLDGDKHYWIGEDEIDKLLRHGEWWLGSHPEKEQIVHRYLKRQQYLAREALSRLIEPDEASADAEVAAGVNEEEKVEEKISLHEQRHGAVIAALKASGARSVVDLGCSTGRLLRSLLAEKQFEKIVGMDVSYSALEIASDRLRLATMPPLQRERITLVQGSLMYRDARLEGYDAAAVVEVIEHLDPPRLAAFERVMFEFTRPRTVVITTPNSEYNILFESLPAGQMRHRDHRFEWTRAQFQAWSKQQADRFNYRVRFLPIGPADAAQGAPTQMAIFDRANGTEGV